jgi:ATPase subunit of ABC transporter with duplicated ATPase domains
MRVALAQILLAQPDVLLLDEPTNYLDLESILWLEAFLKAYQGAVVMTCHDREIMNRIVSKIIEIDGGADPDLHRQLRVLRAGPGRGVGALRGRVRAPAGDAGQGEPLHRAVRGPRRQGRAGRVAGQEARQDREAGAAAPDHREEASGSAPRAGRATT